MRAIRWMMTALVAFVAACSALQPPAPEPISLHVITARPLPSSVQVRRDVVIEVAQPRAWPGFDTPEIIYARDALQLEHFATHRWVDSPQRMLAPLIVRALEDTHAFRAVVTAPSITPADYRLDTEVARLLQDFSARPSSVRVALRAQITDLHTRRQVATRAFEAVVAAPTDDAPGGVAAANDAIAQALAELTQFCLDRTRSP